VLAAGIIEYDHRIRSIAIIASKASKKKNGMEVFHRFVGVAPR
jgi:hypothetical protein